MPNARVMRRIEALEQRLESRTPGLVRMVIPDTVRTPDAWAAAVRDELQWVDVMRAWALAVDEGRARLCAPCGKRFIRGTTTCPGCGAPTQPAEG